MPLASGGPWGLTIQKPLETILRERKWPHFNPVPTAVAFLKTLGMEGLRVWLSLPESPGVTESALSVLLLGCLWSWEPLDPGE